MNTELIRFYNTCGIDKPIQTQDVISLTHVGNDNILDILADMFGVKWTYEITKEDIVNIKDNHYIFITLVLYTPCKIMTGTSTTMFITARSREDAITSALVNAFNNTIQRQILKANIVSNINEEQKEEVIEENFETKEEAADINTVEQTDIEECSNEIDAVSASDLSALEEEIKNAPVQVENNGGIRNDQIEFLNSFKEKHNIDTDKKFNYYVRVWSDTTSYDISTKRELASAGANVIDEFIKWVQDIVIDKVHQREVVSPI